MNHTAVLPTASPESVGLCPVRLARLDAALQAEIDRGKLPGAVAMVARRGRIAHFEAYGRRDPKVDAPMQKDAVFRIYSMTKPVVSVAVMMLVEQGRLLLAQPVATYLPEYASVRVHGDAASGRPGPITVHDLLRHTAGLTYQFLGDGPVHQAYGAAGLFGRRMANPEFSKALAALPLLHAPGTAWSYGHATDVLGCLVEAVTGRPLGDWLQQHVFGPLGMVDTAFHVDPAQHHRIAEPYADDPDTGEHVSVFDVRGPRPHEMGGAGLTSTATDYARFMEMLLAGGALGGERLLGPRTVRLMTADHLGGLPRDGDLLPAGYGFGLGFGVRLAQGMAAGAGSAGMYYWAGIAGTSFFIDPAEQLHAQLMIQQPGRRDLYRQLFRELVYAALVD